MMVDQQLLGRVLKDAMKAGRYAIGAKEVVSEMKASKVVITSTSLTGKLSEELASEAAKNKVPVVSVAKTSAQLGRMIGRPYSVSAIALRNVSEQDLSALQV